MSPELRGRVQAVFCEAVEMPTSERAAFIDGACGSDAELHREVDLLFAAAEAQSVPPISARAMAHALMSPDDDPLETDAGIRALLEAALGNEYRIGRCLGRGGMGAVYLACERALNLDVAIKVLRPDLAAFAPAARARFKREAQICASLEHPGIVRLYRYGEAGGLWYFVMSYVPPGETLAKRLKLEGRVPNEDARRLLLGLADALEHAHASHIIHRDIKPANILLKNGDVRRPMLADFGISKVQGLDTLTPSATVIGTPAYMSPEQLRGDPDIDERSDIYSLGLVGYAMVRGEEAFLGGESTMGWRVRHEPEPLAKVAPWVPPALATVIMHCLAPDRDERWPDARRLKEALERANPDAAPVLPPAVRDLPGYGQWALAWWIVWTMLAVVPTHPMRNRALLLLLSIQVPIGLALHIWNVGRGGLSYRELAHIACWPPEWWGMWWPRMLRRPQDLWPRLPWMARFIRISLSLCYVALPALILYETGPSAAAWIDTAQYALLAWTALATIIALSWARYQGLAFADAVRVLFGATMPSPAWKSPRVAQLLAPTGGTPRRSFREPEDCLRAIDEVMRQALTAGARLETDVTRLARRLLEAIRKSESDIAFLDAQSNDAALLELQMRLSRYDDAISLQDSDSLREGRNLVDQQIKNVQRMRVELEVAKSQRQALFDLMRSLSGLVDQLYGTSDRDPLGSPDPGRDLRLLCAGIEKVLDGPDSNLPPAAPSAA